MVSAEEGVSFVIPVHNEEEAIPLVLDTLKAHIKEENLKAEILVVDDGSTDQTASVAASKGARVISVPMNVGYGAALKRGIEAASFSKIVITDGDASYPLQYAATLIRQLDRFDLAIGRRTGSLYYRSLLSYPFRLVYLALIWFVVGRKVPDPNSGLRAFHREDLLPFLPVMCLGFSFTTSMTVLYLLSGKTVSFIPIPYYARVGRSKIRFFRDMLRTGQLLVSVILLYNPIKLFVLIAGATFLGGMGVLARYALSARVGEGWLVGGIALLGFGGLFFCLGLVADILANLRRRPDAP